MIENDDISSRHAIPRWRSLSLSMASGELCGAPVQKETAIRSKFVAQSKLRLEADFVRKKNAWIASNEIFHAEELVTCSLISGQHTAPEVLTAAVRLCSDEQTSVGMQEFARRIIDGLDTDKEAPLPVEEAKVRIEISKRKKQLSLNPRDGLRLAETALLYANIGQFDTSRRLLERALKTHPEDRYVLRSVARFFTHIGKPEIAVNYLKKSRRVQIDPWISSALLATAATASEPIENWKNAKRILANGNFSAFETSELSAQLGSLEIESGGRARSLKFLRQSAVDPTENAIAQLEWVGRKTHAFEPEEMIPNLSKSHEAAANAAFWQNNWASALKSCDLWHELEPFSVRPAIFGSYVASITSKSLEHGLALAEAGLRANPNEATLWNNIAVMKAYKGDTDGARKAFQKSTIGYSETNLPVVALATAGLIEIRSENIDAGISRYLEAIERASKAHDPTSALRAYAFLGREISLIDQEMQRLTSIELAKAIDKFKKRDVAVPRDVHLLKSEIDSIKVDKRKKSILALQGLGLAERLLN